MRACIHVLKTITQHEHAPNWSHLHWRQTIHNSLFYSLQPTHPFLVNQAIHDLRSAQIIAANGNAKAPYRQVWRIGRTTTITREITWTTKKKMQKCNGDAAQTRSATSDTRNMTHYKWRKDSKWQHSNNTRIRYSRKGKMKGHDHHVNRHQARYTAHSWLSN